MSDHLLPYFNRELIAIRQLAAEFAQAHPKIAGRLRLAPDLIDDPHVARLLDGVAFLSARVHERLDDEFPELTDALLGALYPHFLAPIPSCSIVQFHATPDLAAHTTLRPGFVMETEPVRGQACRYRSVYPVELWPVRIESARLTGLPFVAPVNPMALGATSVLRLVVSTASPDLNFATLGLDRLRLYLRGAGALAPQLYELLMAHTIGVALADAPGDPAPVLVGRDALRAVGFDPDDSLLPYAARSFAGFRLISEYFAFPEKFLFVDIDQLDRKTLLSERDRIEIFIYLDAAVPELERAVSADNFALGCTPVVNLFNQHCEPIAVDHTDIEYRVVPDARRSTGVEIWGITQVRAIAADGSSQPWREFYRLTEGEAEPPTGFYQERRRDAASGLTGSETFIAPYVPDFSASAPAETILAIDAVCFNRDLPADLPFGGGQPKLSPISAHDGVARIHCLTAPTATLRPQLREHGAWKLISHLSLGHLSMTGGADGAAALREILRLYDRAETAESRAAITALVSITSRPGTARVPDGRLGGFCRGLDVTIEFDAKPYRDSGLFLMASVLERFLALHGTINSFVRTTVRLRGMRDAAMRFPARAGTRTLV
ncbi:MAG TPA: type VI secretion system baseplate subunit TssF [Acidiphilium sp.]|nr:MAG: type VI secretion system protein ImpG [Acidiphilium sp. 21-60-14]OYV92347.1 MAG: type VI secretion system protein ImpG [Acidiphilium sp. 37-60-79]OZB40312.1 MAG: type VI secretion system protein ImpG [Acidiphilium sp. 34-60-192]HQT88672.1 type VI secretion system baseplate subunit TssF [Acidiphilium sp.]HQU23625.1 type VI secretion system baseplate subunit TssF [Acidiphilium sp.]